MSRAASRRVLARFRQRTAAKKKRMVVMMGPPAAGKGFFLGEPEKDDKGNLLPPPKDKFGWKLPENLVDADGKKLLTDEDIPDQPTADESDNHLRALQFQEAAKHYDALKAAKEKGADAFQTAMADHWYGTKDGGRVELKEHVSFDKFPEDFSKYFEQTNKKFYVSMRGWHNDVEHENEVTGKPKERFKDQARHLFDESVSRKIDSVEDMLIVDSAGEDIDAQDYAGQIEQAKAAGYEVTVVFLHPHMADTELSNHARGKVMNKRMVDQVDITNWYERNAEALRDIQAAAPHNFCHYRKGPQDSDPKVAEEQRAKGIELMGTYQERIKAAGNDKEKQKAIKKEIDKIIYGAPYKLHKETSYGQTLSLGNKEPETDIASAVEKMNEKATKFRAEGKAALGPTKEKTDDKEQNAAPAKKDTKRPSALKKDDSQKKKTRMNFLREEGDRKVSNPNPESRHRHPQIKLRSLPWQYQKPYYERWSQQQQRAAAIRVARRYKEAQHGW